MILISSYWCPLNNHYKKLYLLVTLMSGKVTFNCQFICVICSLSPWIFIKPGEQHTCSGVILPLMGCFCENLRGYLISQLQVVFEWQLDLNSFPQWHTWFFFLFLCIFVQEKESASREGVREGETSAWKSGGERKRPLQEGIHRYGELSIIANANKGPIFEHC